MFGSTHSFKIPPVSRRHRQRFARYHKTTDERISPIIEAAIANDVETLKALIDSGVYIEKPHHLPCWCLVCRTASPDEQLDRSRYRLLVYKALASPSWLVLTSNDPIYEAFVMCEQLRSLSIIEREYCLAYKKLIAQCEQLPYDLLELCRSSEELVAMLNRCVDDPIDEPLEQSEKITLDRLNMAIEMQQREFVAHPHCQQLLTSIWYEGFPGRQERGSLLNILICILLMVAWPVMSIAYVLAPKSRIGQVVRSPFMKFLYYSTSFGTFLLLLSFVSLQRSRRDSAGNMSRGPLPSAVEWLVFFYVIGMIWAEVKQIWDEGFVRYIAQWWNYLDFAMMCLYLCCFSARAVAIYFSYAGLFHVSVKGRPDWEGAEPLLISEGLFAVANVFSFARIVYLFQTNPYLGPLQISLGCMLLDIAKFFIIFFLILTSFAFGLHQLYWHYIECDDKTCDSFTTITQSYVTLLWALFGITQKDDAKVTPAHYFTEWIGTGLYISYHVTSIVVLLNMLIAMMSFSFQRINENSDLEWKFHRSKLWMSYFDEGSSLAAPFNLIVTPKSIMKVLRWILECMKRFAHGTEILPEKNSKRGGTIRRPGYNRKKNERRRPMSMQDDIPTYREIMERLVHRYIHMMKKEMKMDGVNEDDLLEIKQDISSLRFELRDDRRREILRWSNQLDGTKREIIRTLSIAPKDRSRILNKRSTIRESSLSPPPPVDGFGRQLSASSRQQGDSGTVYSPTLSPCPSPTPTPTSFFADIEHRLPSQPESSLLDAPDSRSSHSLATPDPAVKPQKKLSSVSFKEPATPELNRQTGRAARYGSEKISRYRRPDDEQGVLITLSPAHLRHSTSVQTDPEPVQHHRTLDSLRSDILRLIDQHSRAPSVNSRQAAARSSVVNINGSYEETLAALINDKESII